MSFILDALRKSELERKRQTGPSLATAPESTRRPTTPWVLLALAVLAEQHADLAERHDGIDRQPDLQGLDAADLRLAALAAGVDRMQLDADVAVQIVEADQCDGIGIRASACSGRKRRGIGLSLFAGLSD